MSEARKAIEGAEIPKAQTWYTTGLDLLDLCVGGAPGAFGFPGGYIINFVGDKSAGKTLLYIEMLIANKRRFGKVFKPNHDDSESGCTFDTKALYGVDLMEGKEPTKSATVEEMDANVGNFLSGLGKNGKGIYVVDSLDGLSSNDNEERAEVRMKLAASGKDVENRGSYGMGSAKFLSQDFFKTKAGMIQNHDALLIIVSQVRENLEPGMFKPKYTRSGGKALDFYAHTCLWLSTVRKIIKKVGDEERVVGVIVQAETKKSKTPRPYRKVRFSLYFDYGMDNIGSNIDYLFDLRKDDGSLKPGADSIPWKGKQASFQDLLAWLKEIGEYEGVKLAKRKETGTSAIGAEWLGNHLQTTPELKAKLEETFGQTMSRDALVKACEDSPSMAEELTQRVREKWEAIESSMSSERKPKYA